MDEKITDIGILEDVGGMLACAPASVSLDEKVRFLHALSACGYAALDVTGVDAQVLEKAGKLSVPLLMWVSCAVELDAVLACDAEVISVDAAAFSPQALQEVLVKITSAQKQALVCVRAFGNARWEQQIKMACDVLNRSGLSGEIALRADYNGDWMAQVAKAYQLGCRLFYGSLKDLSPLCEGCPVTDVRLHSYFNGKGIGTGLRMMPFEAAYNVALQVFDRNKY